MLVRRVRLEQGGRLTLPADVLVDLRAETDDEFILVAEDGRVVLQRGDDLRESLEEALRGNEGVALAAFAEQVRIAGLDTTEGTRRRTGGRTSPSSRRGTRGAPPRRR